MLRTLTLLLLALTLAASSAQASITPQQSKFLKSVAGWGHVVQQGLDRSVPHMKKLGLDNGKAIQAECDQELRLGMTWGTSSYDTSLWYENSIQTPQRAYALVHLLKMQQSWNQLSYPRGWKGHWNRLRSHLNWHTTRIQSIAVQNTCTQVGLWNGAGWQMGTIPTGIKQWSAQYLKYFNPPVLSSKEKQWWNKQFASVRVSKSTRNYILQAGWIAELQEAWRQAYLEDEIMKWAYPA